MRSSRATLFLVATIAAAACIQTGCGYSRLGKTASNMSFSRPRLLGRGDKPDTSIASTKPKPPSSSIPPAGTSVAANASTSGSPSRSFPSEPAPSSYASTSAGSGDYAPAGNSYGSTNRGEEYASPSGRDNSYAATSGGGSQRGFYDTEYQGGGSQTAGSRSGGSYDNYDNRGGAQADFGQSYAGSGSRDQQQVADRRGDTYSDSYSNGSGPSQWDAGESTGGGSSSSAASSYGNDPRYGSPYGAQSNSRAVSPGSGGSNYDDYRSPAQDNYNNNYNNGGNYNAGASTNAGGNYESTYNAGDNYSTPNASVGGGANASATGSTSNSWLPGSTGRAAPYGQKPLAPPTTNSGW